MSVATTRSISRMHLVSVGVVLAGLAMAVVAQAVGVEDGLPAILAATADLIALSTLVWFIVWRRPAQRLPWVTLVVSLIVTAVAEVGIRSDLTTNASAIEFLRLVSLGGYVVSVGSLALVAANLGAAKDRSAILDGLIVGAGVAAVAWALVEGPSAYGFRYTSQFDALTLVRPALGLILVGVTVALFFRIGRASPTLIFLMATAVFQLFGDTVGAAHEMGLVPGLSLSVITFTILSSMFQTAALVDPSATLLIREGTTGVPISLRTRIAILAAAAIAASAAALYGVLIGESLLIGALTDALAGFIVILFAIRIWLMTGQLARTQADLEERSAFLSGLAEAMPGAIFSGDVATHAIDYASPGFALLTGWPESEFLGKPGWLAATVHPDDRPRFRAVEAAAIAGGETTSSVEIRVRRPDDTYRTLLIKVRYQGAAGAPERVLGVAIDVTEQAEAESRLAERERFIADIARASRAMLIAGRTDRSGLGIFEFVSPSVKEMLGYDAEEILREPGFFRDRLHPDDRPLLDDARDASDSGATTFESVRRYRARDGGYRSLLMSASFEKVDDGTLRFVISAIDITDRVSLEDELRRAREFSENIIATSPGMTLSGSLRPSRIAFMSPGVEGILGYMPQEVTGEDGWLSTHLHPDEAEGQFTAMDAAVAAGGGEVTRTIRLLAKDGRYRSVLYTARVAADGTYVASAMDVTESVAAAEELERSRRLVADIVSTNPGMIFSGRLAPRVIDFVSPGVEQLLGYTPESIVGVDDWIPLHMHPDDLPAHMEMIKVLVADRGGVATTETRIRAVDGSWRTLLVSMRMSLDSASGPVYFASAIDVTARKRAEIELQQSRDFVASLLTASPGLVIEGPAGDDVLDYVSPSVERLLGYRADEILGVRGWTVDHLHPEDRPALAKAIAAAKAAPGTPANANIRLRGKDRWYRHIVVSVLAFAGADGEMRLIATGLDVGESVRLEEEARQARAFIESILATTPGVIVRGRLQSDVLDYVSPGIQDVLGYDPGEIIGVEGWPSAHRDPDEEAQNAEALARAVAEGAPGFTLVQRFRTRKGEWRSLLLIGRLDDPDAEERSYVATAIDITDRIHMEEDLRAARDAAEAADRAKSEFLSLVSHELRTPLNSILGFGGLLDGANLPAEDRESVDFILIAGKRLLGLIDRMLDYARLETGRLHINLGPVILDDVVRQAVERVRPYAEDRKVPILVTTSSVSGLIAMADSPRLISVVEDLVDNAVRHGGKGVHVTVTTRPGTDGRVAVSVEDDGVGMDEKVLAGVFDPLRSDSAGTGATLGLALSRRLVEAMGGAIAIRSARGEGTTVTVEVPEMTDDGSEDGIVGTATGAR